MRALVSLSLVVPALVSAQAVTPPYFSPNAIPSKRTCSSHTFVVEAPAWAPALSSTFATRLTAALPPKPEWFGCSGMFCIYRTTVTPVLRDLSTSAVPAARRDGHRRAFVVRFEWWSPFTSTWLASEVADSQQCNVITALRKAVTSVEGVALTCAPTTKGVCTRQPPVLVSRSCDVVGQDVEAVLPATTLEWAQRRMQVPSGSTQSTVVALVDTGVPVASQAAVGVVSEAALPSFELGNRSEYHPHGLHMAALIRSVSPTAQLRSYRALDRNGMGSLSAVARQVDEALFDAVVRGVARPPMVVNLSVGAPGRFLRPARITGAPSSDNPTVSCSSWEDGAGESLRYVLGVAGDLDAAGPGVLVVASSGNVVLEGAESTPEAAGTATALTSCDGWRHDAAKQPSSFIPAAFGEQPACRPVGPRWAPVVSVGATTWRDVRSTLNQHDAPTVLMAPGERVYANAPTTARTPRAVACATSAAVDLDNGFQLPATVTGTSASAAFVSGAAARVMGQLPGWNAKGVAQLLYVTGQPLCDGADEQRVDVFRASLATTWASCSSLRSCVRSGPAGTVSAEVGTRCALELAACLAPAAPRCSVSTSEPSWEPLYASQVAVAPSVCRSAWLAAPQAFPSYPPRPNPSRFPALQLAGLGPQPSTSGCPNCAVLAGEKLTLLFELEDAMEFGSELREGYVVILENKEPIAFLPVSDGFTWEPGQVGKLPLLGGREFAAPLLDGRLRAAVNLWLVGPSGREARVESPLNVVAD